MAGITIRLSGAGLGAPVRVSTLLNQIVGRMVEDIGLYAERQARLAAPKDTSALARSIVSQRRGLMAEVTSSLAYAGVMELGRRPGAAPPPQQALAGWARRHGFTGSLYVLARSIGRKGIVGRRYFERAANQTIAYLPNLVNGALEDLARAWRGR